MYDKNAQYRNDQMTWTANGVVPMARKPRKENKLLIALQTIAFTAAVVLGFVVAVTLLG